MALSPKVENEMIVEIVRGLSCQYPLCCVLEYAMWSAGVKPKPNDVEVPLSTIVGHTDFPIIFPETVEHLWHVEVFGRIIKPRKNEFVIVRFVHDEYRPCLSCRTRMIGEDKVPEWYIPPQNTEIGVESQ